MVIDVETVGQRWGGQGFWFAHVNFEMFCTHLSRNSEWKVGCINLEIKKRLGLNLGSIHVI